MGLLASLSGSPVSGDPLVAAFIISLFAAFMTSVGSLIALVPALWGSNVRDTIDVLIDVGLGFSSGVMLVAAFTSLLMPSIESYGLPSTLAGFIAGAILVHLVNMFVPHEHLVKGVEGPRDAVRRLRAVWLVAFAIIIHNIPEGLTIGAASAYSIGDGLTVGIAIGIQDLPEGLAVAIPVLATTGKRRLALLVGVVSGLTEVVTAVLAAALGTTLVGVLPYLMGLGAGAMIYVVSHESLPETHRSGHETRSTIAFFVGFILMLILDSALAVDMP